eukprot:TRINITY_DN7768_c0_g1_i1.p1 TRINITY_DN7768_c0_g1~~TRINITY_DN7768_c0_g1_i1.p1  ORF type:complete len:440 (-),score=49.66 TRINITY_DN7768_c0_g1_i1:97-1416(-)
MFLRTLFVIAFLFLLQCNNVYSKRETGHLTSTNIWQFVSIFCYSAIPPETTGNFTAYVSNVNALNAVLALYIDEDPEHKQKVAWSQIYGNHSLTCEEKISLAGKDRVFLITPSTSLQFLISNYSRPHYWYAVIADCSAQNLYLTYDFTFTNPGGAWTRQFSVDEQGLLLTYLIFFILYSIGMLLCGWEYRILRAKKLNNLTTLFLFCIVAAQFASNFFLVIHYGSYSTNGIGAPHLSGFGELLDMITSIALMLLLILIAKGWIVTDLRGKHLIVAAFVSLTLSYFAVFIWDHVTRDPASTVYFYNSVAGIVVIVIRCIIFAWFILCLYQSFRSGTTGGMKSVMDFGKIFFLVFGTVFGIWFLVLPFIAAVVSGVEPWNRLKIATSVLLTFKTIALLFLGLMLWPSIIKLYSSSKHDELTKGVNNKLLYGQSSQVSDDQL